MARFSLIAQLLVPLLALSACAGNEDGLPYQPADSGFGVPVDYTRDGGLDASQRLDAAAAGPTIRVRFVHAFANLGPLTVCHDMDGPSGPSPAYMLSDGVRVLRANFGAGSEQLELPQLLVGALTFHREAAPARGDAGLDAGSTDGGVEDPCSQDTREAIIPLPIPEDWLSGLAQRTSAAGYDPGFVRTISGASAITVLGSGLALSEPGLDQRAEQTRAAWLNTNPADDAGAELRAARERARLGSTFGPRALFQAVPPQPGAQTFSLSLFHAIPNLTDADAGPETESAAVRLCVNEGTVVRNAFPAPPSLGVPFRVRAPLEMQYETRTSYTFRVFVQADFDREKKDCATTGLRPVAEALFPQGRFQAGRSYTLALIGAVSSAELCSASSKSFVRPGCPRPASELTPRLEVLDD